MADSWVGLNDLPASPTPSMVASSLVAAAVLWWPDERLRLIRARHYQRVRRMKGMRRGSLTQQQDRI
jgi:hypothetical protein